jgi:hypothetical protein
MKLVSVFVEKWKERMSNLFLSCFEDVTVMQEKRLHLINTSRSNEDEVENGEQTELQIKRALSHFPECESTEKSCKDVQNDFVPYVILPGKKNQHQLLTYGKYLIRLTGDRHS